jgi:hydrogenase maturation protein HypF
MIPAAGTAVARVARRLRIRGVVQGLGFQPLVCRLAGTHRLTGWVRNGNDAVEIHAEGLASDITAFVEMIETTAPAAARITAVEVAPAVSLNLNGFEILESDHTPRG